MTEAVKARTANLRWLDLSVIIPVHNEAASLRAVHAELAAVLSNMKATWEIIFIDDGSSDATRGILRELAAGHTRAVILGRRFGQTAALAAGIDAARGSCIVTMSGNGRDDPADIPRMLSFLGEGYQAVSGWALPDKTESLRSRAASRLANRLIRFVTGVKLHDFGCTLKAYDRLLFENFQLYGEMYRFIPALAAWMGAEVVEMKVTERPAPAGRVRHRISLSRAVRVMLDLMALKFMLSYTTRPIQVFGRLGILSLGLSALSAAALIIEKLAGWRDVASNSLLPITAILIFVGVQLVSLGLLGEISIRTYHESQKKPGYFVKETLN